MSEIKVDTLTGKTTANDITVTVGATATMSLEQGVAKAWATHTQSASFTLHDSLNVSSLSDVGQGKTHYNWASNFGNAYFSATIGVGEFGYFFRNTPALGVTANDGKTTALIKWESQSLSNSGTDLPDNNITVHGDLA
jgi:hypothetical protein